MKLEGFVRAAALEMPRGLRINAVSPPWVKETMIKFGMDPSPGQAAADVAKAYFAAVQGKQQGQVPRPASGTGLVSSFPSNGHSYLGYVIKGL